MRHTWQRMMKFGQSWLRGYWKSRWKPCQSGGPLVNAIALLMKSALHAVTFYINTNVPRQYIIARVGFITPSPTSNEIWRLNKSVLSQAKTKPPLNAVFVSIALSTYGLLKARGGGWAAGSATRFQMHMHNRRYLPICSERNHGRPQKFFQRGSKSAKLQKVDTFTPKAQMKIFACFRNVLD